MGPEDVRIDRLANGAMEGLFLLLAGQINRKEMEVLAATVETCTATGIKTLTVTIKHNDNLRC
jgi:hypothetical protein